MSESLLTEDKHCPECGELVTDFEGEPVHEAVIDGYVQTLSVGYTLKPCGHVIAKAVR